VTELSGVSHVALNVSDVERSVAWYGEVLGFRPLFRFDTDDFERQVMLHPSGIVVAVSRHRHADADGAYSERAPGLDHLAFAVPSQDALAEWSERLTSLGVANQGVQLTPETGSALVAFKDPDGIALELYVQLSLP
jgi:glyoxylase I family protein